ERHLGGGVHRRGQGRVELRGGDGRVGDPRGLPRGAGQSPRPARGGAVGRDRDRLDTGGEVLLRAVDAGLVSDAPHGTYRTYGSYGAASNHFSMRSFTFLYHTGLPWSCRPM